jgi:hypothetical protein
MHSLHPLLTSWRNEQYLLFGQNECNSVGKTFNRDWRRVHPNPMNVDNLDAACAKIGHGLDRLRRIRWLPDELQ